MDSACYQNYKTCEECISNEYCVWAETESEDVVCVQGDFYGPSTSYIVGSNPFQSYKWKNCVVNGYLLGTSSNYLWECVLLGVICLVFILCLLLIIMGCIKWSKTESGEDFCSGGCCPCGGGSGSVIRKKDYVRGSSGHTVKNKTDQNEHVTIHQLASGAKPMEPTKMGPKKQKDVNIEDIDKTKVPPGFPPAPKKPSWSPGGTEDEYKQYMVDRLKYEEWENKLLLWHRNN